MIGKRSSMLERHEQPRHDREVEGHVALVAVAEVGDGVLGPLVGLGQQHAVRGSCASTCARSSLAGTRASRAGSRSSCPRARTGTGRRRAAARRRPCSSQKSTTCEHRARGPSGLSKLRSGWWRVEAVPVVGLRHRVPGPVRRLEVLEDDARVRVALGRVAPDVEVALGGCPAGARRARWNHGCWSEVWLRTSSVMTRRPRACASRRKTLEVVAACRSRVDVACSRRCRSRRRAAATGRTAAARAR